MRRELALSNHLTPRVNRVSSIDHQSVLGSTVATWIEDLNPKQLPAVARNAGPLNIRAVGVVRRVLSGRGGAADPHGRTGRSGVNSSRPVPGRPRGIEFACGRTSSFGRADKTAKPRGLSPRYFTLACCGRATVLERERPVWRRITVPVLALEPSHGSDSADCSSREEREENWLDRCCKMKLRNVGSSLHNV
jgi:hypothetical protein